MAHESCELGMIGLGVMGRNFLLNLCDHGFAVAGYDKDREKVEALRRESQGKPATAAADLEGLLASLRRPRAVMMLVPAGPPVDAVIGDLLEHLEPDDLVIDGGNSHFPDTDVRAEKLRRHGVAYLGVGVSGGEAGARHGPSIMPGGPREAYDRVAPLLEAAAAQVDGQPCVAYLGPGSSGHYVKMVHNGIEYALMELIAESYHLMKDCLGMKDAAIGDVFQEWNGTELAGYLVEITGQIFHKTDPKTGRPLIDLILDEARQKGTGMWASQDAMEIQVPVPNIDAAVMMRDLSALAQQRHEASRALAGPESPCRCEQTELLGGLREALYAGMIVSFAQGMAQLQWASEKRRYGLKLEDVARIWRGGCIIRASLLEDIRAAFRRRPDLPNLLLDDRLGEAVSRRQQSLRDVVGAAAGAGIPAAGFAAALAYYDAVRSAWLPANLIEAQRDYFGAHTYERIDAKGVFHTEWQPSGGAPRGRIEQGAVRSAS